jgi:hypothetical protein
MPINLFDDDSVEICCTRCGMTTPKTIEWLHATNRYACQACNCEVDLTKEKQLAGLNRPKR